MEENKTVNILGKNIRYLRETRCLSQTEFANELEIGQGRLAFWENGQREMPLDYIIKIADYFGVTTDYLLGHENKEMEEDVFQTMGLDQRLIQIRDFMTNNKVTFDEVETGIAIAEFVRKQTNPYWVAKHNKEVYGVELDTNKD